MDAYKDLLDRRSTFSIDSLLSNSAAAAASSTFLVPPVGPSLPPPPRSSPSPPPPSISYSSLAALRSAPLFAASRLPSLLDHNDDSSGRPGSPILDPGSPTPTTILPGFLPGPFPSPVYGDPALLSHMLASLSQRHQHQILAAAAAATAAASAAAAAAHNQSQQQQNNAGQVRHEEPDTTNEQGKSR